MVTASVSTVTEHIIHAKGRKTGSGGATMLEAKKAIFGSTDLLIKKKDELAEKAMIAAVLVAIQLLLLIQKVTGLGPLFAAMPIFVFLIACEFVIQRVSRYHSVGAGYTAAGMICSVSAGVIQQIGAVLVKKVVLNMGTMPYEYLFRKFGAPVGGDVGQAALALVFQDMGYYWAHRCYHQVQLGWMFHAIHHNNDHYNFAVALRQSWGNNMTSWVFYLPLAFFISPEALRWAAEWNLIYQFWVHTCLVRRTPDWFEYVFSTPSHHRVHHDRRLHKNFGGIFILWDRWFGTFLSEVSLGEDEVAQGGDYTRLDDGEEVSVFGTMLNQENYFTDLWQMQHPMETLKSLRRAKGITRKLKTAIQGAGFYSAVHKDRGIMPRTSVPAHRRIRFASRLPVLGSIYALVHFHIAVLSFIMVSVNPDTLKHSFLGVCSCYLPVVTCLCSLAFVNDGVQFAPYAEAMRCIWTTFANDPGLAYYFYLFSSLLIAFNPDFLRATKVVNSLKAKAI
ncbi:fatty acid hydroxylase [Chloropicon primus]|uniref:Fatty acid hydroxylase n=1 Tax=Chloropicon primus TaxID=1764295 RepID=A0A5B8MJJ6_9CHLO|nr:fatty acid hydroxylase [Chloropicon primus]UPQ99066.1 fatty acid hydroxylase [Chloropicon primus]|mmetsp:Transcript_8448/g.24146  ORF Transcript_8448/g.24146 Transcript_8448/m.24146 type:complete len:505 (+) Transcript_8448:121-1635(+)|eukprot:QDZ19855.1 fatty acid hydroxylase [Chloropicon primus]